MRTPMRDIYETEKTRPKNVFSDTDISVVNIYAGSFMAPLFLSWVFLRTFAWYGAVCQLHSWDCASPTRSKTKC